MDLKSYAAPVVAYAKRRLAEPESRAALAAMLPTIAAYAFGHMGLPAMEYALAGEVFAVVIPAPIRQQIAQALSPPAPPPAA